MNEVLVGHEQLSMFMDIQKTMVFDGFCVAY